MPAGKLIRIRRRGKPSLSKKVNRLAKKVKAINLRAEKHFADSSIALTEADDNGIVSNITGPAQGDGSNHRTGLKIRAKSLGVHFTCRHQQSDSILRLMIFMDRQQVDSTTPSVNDVLDSQSYDEFLDVFDQAGRFKVLLDKTFVNHSGAGGTGTAQVPQYLKKYIKLDTTMMFSTTTSSSISRNGLYALVISDYDSTGNAAQYEARFRLSFYDS
jgi:hypothetical protein